MPINKITINEYECAHCGYKWINKLNYIDGQIPAACAKCKRLTWDTGSRTLTEKIGYIRIVKGFKKLYDDFDRYDSSHKGLKINWPPDLCDQFLNMYPKPSLGELRMVIRSSQIHRYNNGEAIYRTRSFVPDFEHRGSVMYDPSVWEPSPNKPGYLHRKPGIYDDPNFIPDHYKWVVKEAFVRKRMMIDIMKRRGIEYKPVIQKKEEVPSKYMSNEEKKWRRRMNEFHKQYVEGKYFWHRKAMFHINWPIDLCKKFLSIKPRPTVEEMKDIFYNPTVEGVHRLEWDEKAEYKELLKKLPEGLSKEPRSTNPFIKTNAEEILRGVRHKKLMIKVIESRGEKFTYNEDLNLKILQDKFPDKKNKK